MSKKYKLIKEYPGSPILGFILELGNHTPTGHFVQGKWIYQWENNPEYWEEIKEKEYEILAYRSIKGRNIIYSKPEWDKNFFELNKNEWEIYSVKRPDGEVFTIGDIIGNKYTQDTIKQFIIVGNYIHTSIYIRPETGINISDVEKIQQKLFTTEDGVDIYEGDEYYHVFSDFSFTKIEIKVTIPIGICTNTFLTKEKAEEYILMNKPCLSYNNLITLDRHNSRLSNMGLMKISRRLLKDLIKEKLKL